MNTRLLKTLCVVSMAALVQMRPLRGEDAAVDDLVDYINLRLSHSTIKSIDHEGLVTIEAPDETLRFKIQEMSANYNGLNGDDRVRLFCNYCIGRYSGKSLEGTAHRESFLCKSKNHAFEVIDALNRLKKAYFQRDAKFKPFDQNLATGDPSLPFTNVSGAIDYVNRNLTFSAIMNVDERGRMLINAPDDVYEVDLKKAEFGFNDLRAEPNLRIYGEWCLVILRKDHSKELSRESFQINSRDDAFKVIKAMYFIKSAFSGMEAGAISQLRNVTGKKMTAYSTIAQAVDYINDRLQYSIIMRIDDSGVATVNSMDKIFMFSIQASTFSQTHEKGIIKNLINILVHGGNEAVLVESHDGIEGYEGGRREAEADEQPFQCRSEAEAREVVGAFEFIKGKLKEKKGR